MLVVIMLSILLVVMFLILYINVSEEKVILNNQSDNQSIILDNATKFTFHTIEYYGIVHDPDSEQIRRYIELEVALPFFSKAIMEIPPKNFSVETYGVVCNGNIPVAQPLTDVPITFISDNRSRIVNICVSTSFEYTEIIIGKYSFDTHFTAEDCSKAIFEQENKTYINISYRKISCIN